MHPADRPVLGEPALAGGLVDLPSAVPALRPGDPLEDGRADPPADPVRGASGTHLFIIAGPAELAGHTGKVVVDQVLAGGPGHLRLAGPQVGDSGKCIALAVAGRL